MLGGAGRPGVRNGDLYQCDIILIARRMLRGQEK
jgi:hypothetical protein